MHWKKPYLFGLMLFKLLFGFIWKQSLVGTSNLSIRVGTSSVTPNSCAQGQRWPWNHAPWISAQAKIPKHWWDQILCTSKQKEWVKFTWENREFFLQHINFPRCFHRRLKICRKNLCTSKASAISTRSCAARDGTFPLRNPKKTVFFMWLSLSFSQCHFNLLTTTKKMVSLDPKNGDLMVILDGQPGILWRPPERSALSVAESPRWMLFSLSRKTTWQRSVDSYLNV